jgi:uracil phosphoribosyltransferase
VDVLLKSGVPESNIYFFNVVSCPEGIAALTSAYPSVKIITGCIDDGLNEKVGNASSTYT